MKFFIFTCLLAVALANHEIKQRFSSEESVNIKQEKYKQYNDVASQTSQELSSSSSSEESAEAVNEKNEQSDEENVYLKHQNKVKEFYKNAYNQAYQQQRVMNPWNHKKNAYHNSPIVKKEDNFPSEESTRIALENAIKKIFDLADFQILWGKLLSWPYFAIIMLFKMNLLHPKTYPKYIQAAYPPQRAISSWNIPKEVNYPYVPIVELLRFLN